MGYSITIGEAVLSPPDAGDADECPAISVRAEGAAHPDAPVFPGDAATDNTSSRHPSYTAWAEFCEHAGLHRLFYGCDRGSSRDARDGSGLFHHHPGAALLTRKHHAQIAAALDRYRTQQPDARPGWVEHVEGGNPFHGPWKPETEGLDPNLARLLWLEWWVRWALDNCKVPTIYNR